MFQLQDAARKALQDAFKGKKDPFAAEEERRKKQGGDGGGGGGSGGGGGGGGGFGGGFNFGDFSDGFKKWFLNTLRALAATLLFLGFILLFTLWKPLLDLLTKLVSITGHPHASHSQVSSLSHTAIATVTLPSHVINNLN